MIDIIDYQAFTVIILHYVCWWIKIGPNISEIHMVTNYLYKVDCLIIFHHQPSSHVEMVWFWWPFPTLRRFSCGIGASVMILGFFKPRVYRIFVISVLDYRDFISPCPFDFGLPLGRPGFDVLV